MKIIFSPEYSGHVFARPAAGNVMMDTSVSNTLGLVETLELRLGLHHESSSQHQNLVRYYDAMNRYMKSHPGNCFETSFHISGLKTAQTVMAWRNSLRIAMWDGQGAEISERLKAMAEIERIYRPHAEKDLAERIGIIINNMSQQQLDCCDIEIQLNIDLQWLRPLEKSLVHVMQQHGAQVTILPVVTGEKTNLDIVRNIMMGKTPTHTTFNLDDESIRIYRFTDRQQANEYLAITNLCKADVCIDADNKALDHQLCLMGHPQSGSIAHDSAPQLTQFLFVGIGLFYPQLNINTLLQWLDMPLHPLNARFRSILTYTIIREGGYRNTACQEEINNYINGDYVYLTEEQLALPNDEQQKLRLKKKNERKKKVETFLPLMQPLESISRENLKNVTTAISSWCRQKNLFESKRKEESPWQEQLAMVIDMADTFNLLLNTVDAPSIDPKTVESWISAIDKKGDFVSTRDERGCTAVVSHPSHIATIANTTLWASFNGEETLQSECSFLSPSEKKALIEQGHIQLWGESENQYRNYQELIPLQHTSKRLILIVCDRHEGKIVAKHPLLIRLEQQFGDELETITRYPTIDDSELSPAEKIRNDRVAGVLEFHPSGQIQWPGHLSPTYIRNLVDDPFSYMMDQLLKIQPDTKDKMLNINTTCGNVAHKVIEMFFSPVEGQQSKHVDTIENDIVNHYDTVFVQAIETCGSIFLLKENHLEMESLRIKLRKNLSTLCNIIRSNNLSVVSCETPSKSMVGFDLPKEIDSETGKVYDVKGVIDMILEDSDSQPVVFDFKWTNRTKYYRETLENNDSIQLEFYRFMIQDKCEKGNIRVAYFLMPTGDGRLYSLDSFVGNNCIQVTTKNNIDVVAHTVELVKQNKDAIDKGQVDVSKIGDYSNYKMFVVPPDNNNN